MTGPVLAPAGVQARRIHDTRGTIEAWQDPETGLWSWAALACGGIPGTEATGSGHAGLMAAEVAARRSLPAPADADRFRPEPEARRRA